MVEVEGVKTDGGLVTNVSANAGRVVVIGREPLLEALITTNGAPALVLYGPAGSDYVVEATSDLRTPNPWPAVWQGDLDQPLPGPRSPARHGPDAILPGPQTAVVRLGALSPARRSPTSAS